jgi:hypothetical protein
MKKYFLLLAFATIVIGHCFAQDVKASEVPQVVKTALSKKYPEATKVSWEKENGNYEANWGGGSGEDNAAQFTPEGVFVEIEKAIPLNELPAAVISYVKEHGNGAKIKEAARVTDANGKVTYEAEVKGKDLVFDENGNYLRTDTGD